MHLEQPCSALCPQKPHTFRAAGISHATQMRAARTNTNRLSYVCIVTAFHNSRSSLTKGLRKVFIVNSGSFGPGMTPSNRMFSLLKRSVRGRLSTAT